MGLYSGGLVIGRIIAFVIWEGGGAYIRVALYLGGLIIEKIIRSGIWEAEGVFSGGIIFGRFYYRKDNYVWDLGDGGAFSSGILFGRAYYRMDNCSGIWGEEAYFRVGFYSGGLIFFYFFFHFLFQSYEALLHRFVNNTYHDWN